MGEQRYENGAKMVIMSENKDDNTEFLKGAWWGLEMAEEEEEGGGGCVG